MKKKTDEELGILLTREMQTMMFNEKLTAEQRVALFCSIVSGQDVDDPLLSAFAESLKSGFIHANNARKSSIYNRRERQKNYLRSSTPIYVDSRSSTSIDAHRRSSPIKGKGKGICNIPLTPKGGKGEPPAISPEQLTEDAVSPRAWAERYAAEIATWYPYVVNLGKLTKTLLDAEKKHSARAVEDGIARWRASGLWDDARFVPRRIVAWIQGGSFLDEPPQKNPGARADGGGTGGAAPSADATLRMLQDDGEE